MLQPDDVKTDHYAALGVSKETDLTKIRGAYRKLALSLHPDKIKDESQRESAREEWHRVQKAYEILSDDKDRFSYDTGRAKFLDKEAKLAQLKRELREHRRTDSSYASPRGSGSASAREMRNGHIVEERVPMESYFDEAMRFTDEPNPMGRKNDDFGRRTKPKPTDDRKKARVPPSSQRAAKDLRDSTKASMADRAKKLDRERRRDASAKYEEKFDSYAPRIVDSESETDFSGPEIYLRTREPSSSRRTRESTPRESRSRPTMPAPRRRDTYYEDDDYSDDGWSSKLHGAQEHIQRSKYEGDVRPRTSRSPPRRRGYEPGEPDMSASRRAARSSRSTKDSTRDRDRSSSRNNSYEKLDSRSGDYFKPPKMPSATTSPNVKSSIRPSLFARATTATATAFTRPKRESSSRNESTLDSMSREQVPTSRSSKLRNNDSGYSSSSTPEMPQHSQSPKVARYTIDPETITIEPSRPKYHRMASPERERPTRTMPKRASTFAEPSRIEIRSVKPSRTYTDVEYSRKVGRNDVQYSKEIRPGDASYSPSRQSQKIPSSYYNERHPPPSRRQSTAA